MHYDAQYSLLEYELDVAKQHYDIAKAATYPIGQRLYSAVWVYRLIEGIYKRALSNDMPVIATMAHELLPWLEMDLWSTKE